MTLPALRHWGRQVLFLAGFYVAMVYQVDDTVDLQGAGG